MFFNTIGNLEGGGSNIAVCQNLCFYIQTIVRFTKKRPTIKIVVSASYIRHFEAFSSSIRTLLGVGKFCL